MFRVLRQLNVLPSYWQDSATLLAELCHRIGKTLPPYWQNSAIVLARLCHQHGKTLRFKWQNTAKGMKDPVLFI